MPTEYAEHSDSCNLNFDLIADLEHVESVLRKFKIGERHSSNDPGPHDSFRTLADAHRPNGNHANSNELRAAGRTSQALQIRSVAPLASKASNSRSISS